MSRSLGSQLPEALLARLLAAGRAERAGDVVVLATVDPYGWPHPALISYAELLAVDAVRLRLALYAGSRSTGHLRDTGRATLVFADAELVLYVKADGVPLPPAPGQAGLERFELHVRDVLEDRAEGEEAGARLLSGLTAEWPGGPAAAQARQARLRALLSA